LAPDDQSIILSLASAEQAEGRPDQAIQLLENELRRRPGWADGHSALAKLRWMMGEEGSYGRSFDEALAERPTELLLWRDYIGLVMQGCRFEEALAIVRRGREAVGSHPIFDAHEAVCRDELGDWQGAETLFQPLVRKPDVATAVYYIRHLLRGGRVAEAARIAEAGMAQAAPSFAPYLSIAWRLLDDPRWQWLEGDPSLVGVYDLGDDLDLDALAPRLRALHMVRNQPLDQSLRGGTQSAGYLFARVEPPIRQLRAAIVAAVSRHIEQLSPFDPRHPILSQQRDRPIRFSGAWSVRLTGGGSHVNHLHPGGWFSSAFYAAIPAESERGPEPAGWLSLGAPPVELGLSLEPFRTVEPKPGRLVLFPSTMWHGTVPFDQGERLTVAFDVATPRAQLAVPR
jgi:tetratricopeptide (TPR) repeat protein